jgi:hypothetical protein
MDDDAVSALGAVELAPRRRTGDEAALSGGVDDDNPHASLPWFDPRPLAAILTLTVAATAALGLPRAGGPSGYLAAGS